MRFRRLLACLAAFIVAIGLSTPASGQLLPRPPEEWIKTLDGPKRVSTLKIDEIISTLHLKPGQTIADIGAGSGLLEVPFAKAVSPGGKVYAVDVYPEFFDAITQKTREAKVTNVQNVLGKFEDPNLPAKDVDVAMFHDVLHHIEKRAEYLTLLATYMKPTGRIAVIDYEGVGPHPEKVDQVTKAEVTAWMAAVGYTKVEDIALFPGNKMYVVYSRP